jgi:cytoskeleton protein RodZ
MGASNAPSSARLADANAIPAVPSEIQIEQGLNQAMQAQVPKMTTSVQTPDVTVPPATPATPAQPDPAADMAAVTGDGVASETPLPTIEVEPDADLVATPATEQTSETAATIPPPPPAPAAPKKEIIINVKDRSWVEVRDKRGKTILSRILRPGEVFIVPEENYGLRLDTGNAGGLELVVNGQKIPALGRQGDILRGFILDGESILNNGALATRGLNQ